MELIENYMFGGVLRQSAEVHDLIAPSVAMSFQALPLDITDGRLVVAFIDPVDEGAVARFGQYSTIPIRPIACSAAVMKLSLHLAYERNQHKEVIELVDDVAEKTTPSPGASKAPQPMRRTNSAMKVIAVTGGKGGIGKTAVSANLSTALAQAGYRVGIIDCDFGLSKLGVSLGVKPTKGLTDVLSGRSHPTSAFTKLTSGLEALFVNGYGGELADIHYAQFESVGLGVADLESRFDFLFFDMAAGIHSGVASFLREADENVIVLSSDPSSVQDAFVTVRTILNDDPRAQIACVMNGAQKGAHPAQVYAKFRTYLQNYDAARVRYLGEIPYDKTMAKAAQLRLPIVQAFPKADAAKAFQAIASRFADMESTAPKLTLIERILRRDAA